MSGIYKLSWDQDSFWAKFRLFLKARRQVNEFDLFWLGETKVYSALSSTYYSIVGTAHARWRSLKSKPLWPLYGLVWAVTWLPLGAWCYWRMIRWSDLVVVMVGYDNISADQCDIRQSILRAHGRYEEAKKCIFVALDKKSHRLHTCALLRVGLASVLLELKDDQEHILFQIENAVWCARQVEVKEPRQAIRIYRQCADLLEKVKGPGRGKFLRYKATKIAQGLGVKDQLLKI